MLKKNPKHLCEPVILQCDPPPPNFYDLAKAPETRYFQAFVINQGYKAFKPIVNLIFMLAFDAIENKIIFAIY